MPPVLALIFRTVLIIVATLIGLRVITLFIQRIPGVVVSLSLIGIGVLAYALYKGSFEAIGLRNRKSIGYAMAGTTVICIIAACILLFVER